MTNCLMIKYFIYTGKMLIYSHFWLVGTSEINEKQKVRLLYDNKKRTSNNIKKY